MNNGKIKRISYRALSALFIICIAISIAKTVDADSKEWISYGETVSGYLSSENQSDNYYFNGYKGDTIHITMEKIKGDLEPFLALSYIDTKDNSALY